MATQPRARFWRWSIASRVIAATIGGYVLASVAAVSLALLLPTTRVEATVTASLASLAVYTCAVLWAFATRTATGAWMGIVGTAAVLAAITAVGRLS